MKVEILSFENDVVEFELYTEDEVITCIADMTESDLQDFINGEFVIEPSAWFDSEECHIDKPEWFNEKESKLLNEAFEVGYKAICESMVDDQGGM